MSDAVRALREVVQRRPTSQKGRAAYLRELWDMHDWMEREILHQGRHFTDKDLTVLMEQP